MIGREACDVTMGIMRARAVSGCLVPLAVTSLAHYEEIKR